MPSATQVVGGAVIVGGILWWWHGGRKSGRRSIPALPPKNTNYPIPAETSQYPDPPASQSVSQPSTLLGTACPTISTPEEYNAYAVRLGLPTFDGILPTNAPDDPAVQTFNTLVTGLKTMAGCFAPMDQDSTSTSLPSNWAEQSASYK